MSDGPDNTDKPHALDHWQSLRQLTQARIAIGRAGDAQTTEAVLEFEVAQAQARDAVHLPLDVDSLQKAIEQLGLSAIAIESSAPDRMTYLRRPDAGRKLSTASREAILAHAKANPASLTIVIADGLSAAAPARHAVSLLAEMLPQPGFVLNPNIFIATRARVALGDEIGELLNAQAILMLIGERPGLTTPESLGAYLTWHPRVGRTDAERNCVSNIHARGLSYADAAHKLSVLLDGAQKLGATGIALHDESDASLHLPPGSPD